MHKAPAGLVSTLRVTDFHLRTKVLRGLRHDVTVQLENNTSSWSTANSDVKISQRALSCSHLLGLRPGGALWNSSMVERDSK